jgi:hypothetical protein
MCSRTGAYSQYGGIAINEGLDVAECSIASQASVSREMMRWDGVPEAQEVEDAGKKDREKEKAK